MRWSPRDLDRQRRIVASLATRADRARRQLRVSQHELSARVRATLSSPGGLLMSFASGVLVGDALQSASARRRADTLPRRGFERARAAVARLVWLAGIFDQFKAGWQIAAARQSAGGVTFDG